MILYTLACDGGHRFESWFPGSAAFDEQAAAGLVACPTCGSPQVAKAIMAPAIVGGRQFAPLGEAAEAPEAAPLEVAAVPGPLLDSRQQEIRTLVKAFRDKILAAGQDVGARFPEEARRMHEGEIETRPIHGQATLVEARALIEDGIMVMPLPILPDELN